MTISETNQLLEELLDDYRDNTEKIWDIRSEEIFDRWKDETGDFRVISQALDAIKPSSLLEIGYGYGRLNRLYVSIPMVAGLDVSRQMLHRAVTYDTLRKPAHLVCGDIRNMPFKDSSYDCIISIRTLNHVHPDDLPFSEKEISRVCRRVFVSLESDKKQEGTRYEFEHDHDNFLAEEFSLTKKKSLENAVFLRIYLRR